MVEEKKTFGAQPRELVQQGSQGVLSVQPTSGIICWMFETCITIVSRHDGCQAMSWYVITRLQSNLTFGILRLYTWYDRSSILPHLMALTNLWKHWRRDAWNCFQFSFLSNNFSTTCSHSCSDQKPERSTGGQTKLQKSLNSGKSWAMKTVMKET